MLVLKLVFFSKQISNFEPASPDGSFYTVLLMSELSVTK